MYYENEINKIRKDLKLIDSSIYNDKFDSMIRARGEIYYLYNKVSNVIEANYNYTATVNGTNDYKVSIKFDGDEIKHMNCECEYFKKGNNCKHIYALIIYIKFSDNYKKINKECLKLFNKLKNSYKTKNIEKYDYSKKDLEYYINSLLEDYERTINNLEKRVDNKIKKEYEGLNLIRVLKINLEQLESSYREFDNLKLSSKPKTIQKSNDRKLSFSDITESILNGFIFGLLLSSHKKKRRKKIENEIANGNFDDYIAENGFIGDLMELYDDEDFYNPEFRD